MICCHENGWNIRPKLLTVGTKDIAWISNTIMELCRVHLSRIADALHTFHLCRTIAVHNNRPIWVCCITCLIWYQCKFLFLCSPHAVTHSVTTISYFILVLPFQQSLVNFILDIILWFYLHVIFVIRSFASVHIQFLLPPYSVPIYLCLRLFYTPSE